ncbi:MAG: WbqC family protein [Fibrobacteria bacterium]|nr:WbqC family protein [Fibrobacteria bacterium]
MTLAAMQPYVLPYIGYFQLIQEAGTFVILDDVAFIKKGWIHRNRILLGGSAHLFTLPLQDASQNRSIKDTFLVADDLWKLKLVKTIRSAYAKALHFREGMAILEEILETRETNLSRFAVRSLETVARELGITTTLRLASEEFPNLRDARGQDRILDLCMASKATRYVNAIGGMELYHPEAFREKDVELRFLRTKIEPYFQLGREFVPYLSILDLLMFLGAEQTREHLRFFDLVE